MAYDFYIGRMLLPVPPAKLKIKINNGNKTYQMMNEGEINVLKTPGLTDIELEVLLPNTKYPFAVYLYGFQPAAVYLEELERLKLMKERTQFIVSRVLPDGKILFDTNITCSLESYEIMEDKEDSGTDIMVSISLKQYRDYGVKTCKVTSGKALKLKKVRWSKIFNLHDGDVCYVVERTNGGKTAQIKLKKKMTLYNLAKKIYGNGSLFTIIAEANGKSGKWKKSTKLKAGKLVVIPMSYYG